MPVEELRFLFVLIVPLLLIVLIPLRTHKGWVPFGKFNVNFAKIRLIRTVLTILVHP